MERASSADSTIHQQSMDVDSSPAVTRRQHTCNTSSSSGSSSSSSNQLSVSPSAMEFIIETAAAAVPKKCTCPYERPTLKTMEAAIAAAGVAPASAANSKHHYHKFSSSQSLSAAGAEEEDARNANLIRAIISPQVAVVAGGATAAIAEVEDSLNNNNNNNIGSVNQLACDNNSERGRSGVQEEEKQVNLNSSINLLVNSNDNRNKDSSSASQSMQLEEESHKDTMTVGDSAADQKVLLLQQKKKSSSSKKKQSSAGADSKCSCSDITLRVKAAESPPQQRSSLTRSSLNDGILSNCLSALNFVSGNRIGNSHINMKSSSSSPSGDSLLGE